MGRDRSKFVGLQYGRRPNGRLITRLEGRRSLRIGDVVVLDQQQGEGVAALRGSRRAGRHWWGVRPRPILHVARPIPLRPSAVRRRTGRSCEAPAVQRLADRARFPITTDRPPMAARPSQCKAYNRVMSERRLLKAVELWPQEQQVNASPLPATCSHCRRLGRRPDIPPSTASSVPVTEAACGLAK
jgi:hypothetical protein